MKIKLKCIDCKNEYTLYDFEYFNYDFDISCPKCGSIRYNEVKREVTN